MPSCSPRHIFIFTKPVVQIYVWIIFCTAIFTLALQTWPHVFHVDKALIQIFVYSSIAITYIVFLIGGFLGDVYFGRYRAVTLGLILITLSLIPISVGALLWFLKYKLLQLKIVAEILLVASFLLLISGHSLFSSNILQFGVDQLMEKPSETIGVFVHWREWVYQLGSSIPIILYSLGYCDIKHIAVKKIFYKLIYTLPVCFLILFTISLLVGHCTRGHFNRERVKYNPYKMIFKVLNFARKNKYPVGPVSGFAYCDDFRPSRLDYAKERYGGPFTTSDVEDVKAFKNVLLVLLALGPVFSLDPATSYFLFKIFSNHTGASLSFGTLSPNKTCENYVDIVFSGIGTYIAMPIYMWVIYSVLRNRTPKILHRLAAAALVYILAVVSMLAIDLTGHIMLSQHNDMRAMCMFSDQNKNTHQTLEIPWGVVAVPSFLKSFSENIIFATSFEFIFAQSPHTMKGVLVGSFFAIIGVFEVVGAIFLFPFSLDKIWKHGYLGQRPPVVSCGFGYYLVCITVAMIGFISFIVAVKRYKYRRRDEEPYSQACVEEIFARRIKNDSEHRKRERYEELSGINEY